MDDDAAVRQLQCVYVDDEIDRLRRQLQGLVGPARIPVVLQLAQHVGYRWAAQPTAPRAEQDLTETVTLLREAREPLGTRDVMQAQASGLLGGVLAGRVLLHSPADCQDNAERDEAIECLTEATEHPDLPLAHLEMALLYLGMLLIARAIPSGLASGLRVDELCPPSAAVLPKVLDYLEHVAAPERLAELDRAEAHLNRMRSMPPVNEQFHHMGAVLLDQIRMLRIVLGGGGMFDLMKTLTSVVGPWQHPTSGVGASPSGHSESN